MIIRSTLGITFTCKQCGIYGIADRPSDITGVYCNGQEQYYIECPICGAKHHIELTEIPLVFLPRIRRIASSLGAHHD